MLDPSRVLRWVWMGRAVLSCAILIAAAFVWSEAAPRDTLIATLAFAGSAAATMLSALYVQFERRTPGVAYYVLQCTVDLALVTAVVHITGGWSSQFAALYILVIASAAMLLPFQGGLAVAVGASVLYATDVLLLRTGTPYVGVAVQIVVFVVVAIGSGYVFSRLRQAGKGREALAARLVKVQLEAADILRTIRSGIMTVDAHGRLLYANPAASELLGLELRALVGRPILNTLLGVAPELATLLEQSSRDGVRTTRAEGVIMRADEALEIGVTTTISSGTPQDGGATATAIFQDISDSKRVQALHIRAERLQAVAELSASLAHEIRNPLASIRSATEQLSRRRVTTLETSEDDADNAVLHDLVVREADRLSRLLAEFLDFARARVTRITRLDLGSLANSAALLASAHPDRGDGVRVQVTVTPGLPSVEGDEDLLHRAVFNLVLNAVQAVGASGEVLVSVDRFRPAGEHGLASTLLTGELLAVTVSDDGPGVPPELKDRLFEPFVTGKVGGTGLGLPVVHRAVEAHRGVVLVDTPPRGTRFTMLLPTAASTGDVYGGDMPVLSALPIDPTTYDWADAVLPRLTGVPS